MTIRNQNDINTSDLALGPHKTMAPESTDSSYNKPGLPTPPAGWGTDVGFNPMHAPDTSCG
jgi:hypothetical protein